MGVWSLETQSAALPQLSKDTEAYTEEKLLVCPHHHSP